MTQVQNNPDTNANKVRYPFIDAVRGVCILGMIIYHTIFDVVTVFGFDYEKIMNSWFLLFIRDFGAGLFIFLSGLCFHFSSHHIKRFAVLCGAGLAVTGVSFIVSPNAPVYFGILTFMGVSGLILYLLDRPLKHLPPKTMCIANILLFWVLNRMNYAYVGTYKKVLFYLPAVLYRNYVTAFFGFPFNGFVSSDYFAVFPWFFMCLAGYFFYNAVKENNTARRLGCVRLPLFPKIGKYSLWIYLAHQPIIYGIVVFVDFLLKKVGA